MDLHKLHGLSVASITHAFKFKALRHRGPFGPLKGLEPKDLSDIFISTESQEIGCIYLGNYSERMQFIPACKIALWNLI